jgi:hypothetical protein
MVRSIGASLLVVLLSSGVALAQPKPPGLPKPPVVPTKPVTLKPAAVTLELSGSVKLRPQESDRALGASGRTKLLDDESVVASAVVRFATTAERESFRSDFPTLVLQRREGASGPWSDFHVFYSPKQTKATGIPGISGKQQPAEEPKPITQVRPELPRPGQGPTVTAPEIPAKPGQKPSPKVGVPTDAPGTRTVVPGMGFDSPGFTLASGTSAIRASARRADGSSIDSPPLQLEVRKAPAILTLMAQGGACADADGNLDSSGTVTRDDEGCAARGLNGVFLGALTPKASINCNNFCDTGCTNFFEHLAARIMDDEGLADHVDFIDNPGAAFCQSRDNPGGLRNRIVVGKWRNTEEEGVCGTDLQFNDILDDFEEQGGKSVILIGQSLGGAKFTKLQRDNWRWGNAPTLELFVLWDATSLGEDGAVVLGGHPSFGVRTVGSRAKRVLSFFQYDNAAAFQNGARLTDRSDAEQHDYNRCLTHNGIARGQFIHHRTTEAVKQAIVSARDRARE